MPKPVSANAAAETSSSDLTHKVTLVGGKTFTLVDPKRPGAPWTFKENETRTVPQYVADRLAEKAQDSVTVKVGSRISETMHSKFVIEEIAAK